MPPSCLPCRARHRMLEGHSGCVPFLAEYTLVFFCVFFQLPTQIKVVMIDTTYRRIIIAKIALSGRAQKTRNEVIKFSRPSRPLKWLLTQLYAQGVAQPLGGKR